MTENKKKYPLTDLQISQLKKKHGEIYSFEIEGKICYCKKVSLETVFMVTKFYETDRLRAINILVENSWIEGDLEIKEKDEYRLDLAEKLQTTFEKKNGELKKL